MPNPFQNTNIQVEEVTMKQASTGNVKYIILATDKKKYFFYQKNQGVDCDVFQVFNNLAVRKGVTIAIGFTEEEKEFTNKEGKVIKYTDRFIGSMREANDIPVQTPQVSPKTPPQPKYEATEPVKDDTFWDKKAYKQCLWNFWLERYAEKAFGVRNADNNLGNAEMDLVWTVFNQINQDADKRFNGKITGEDIPF